MINNSLESIIMIRQPRGGVIRAARSAAGITLRRRRAVFDSSRAGYPLPFWLLTRPPIVRA